MNSKITRRVALGTIIGGLAIGPFVMRSFRKFPPVPVNPMFLLFRDRIAAELSFPREFNPNLDIGADPTNRRSAPPREMFEKIMSTQKRFWQNYSKLDEIKFNFSSPYYVNGKLKPMGTRFFDADVWIKFGYGVEVKGKNTNGKQVHLVFNIDGEDNQPEGPDRCNLSGFPCAVFGLEDALPMRVKRYTAAEDNISLPNSFRRTYRDYSVNFETRPNGLYTKLTGPYDSIVDAKTVRSCYFSQKTGMLELQLIESTVEGFEFETPFHDARIVQEVNGIYFPVQRKGGKIDKGGVYSWEEKYSSISFKLIS